MKVKTPRKNVLDRGVNLSKPNREKNGEIFCQKSLLRQVQDVWRGMIRLGCPTFMLLKP